MRSIRLVVSLLLFAAPVLAAPFDPSLFHDLRWRLIG